MRRGSTMWVMSARVRMRSMREGFRRERELRVPAEDTGERRYPCAAGSADRTRWTPMSGPAVTRS
ncbi:hypothetical protein C8D89_11725 [Actinomycetospora cinnamomea]|uniref:Uncharacterized protein n=1 Tax=Actinomycetospora cinnamomea TaxID=663609 RepID=A0A2U1EXC3_9PSEU|nr:hypothetical protein C8D89_11725 [Actinomycetospora cinnamomea]